MEDSQTILHGRLIKSEFVSRLETDNNPYDVNFNFSLRVESSEWLIPTTHDSPVPELVGEVDYSVINDYLVSMSRQQFRRLKVARKTMEQKLRGLISYPSVRRNLVEYACDKALRRLDPSNTPAAETGAVLNLHIELKLMIYQFVSSEDQSSPMVPAADSSVEGLKRAVAADYVGRNMSCSICLEEFSGDEEEGAGDDGCCDEEEEEGGDDGCCDEEEEEGGDDGCCDEDEEEEGGDDGCCDEEEEEGGDDGYCDEEEEDGGDDGCCDEEEGLLIMPCSHVFHGGCIKKWLSVSHYCPLCRFELPATTTN